MRDAGLVEGLGARDLGDVAEPLRPPERDARSGIIAFEALVEGSLAVERAVAGAIGGGDRPLVLGGDCSLLIGAIAGARQAGLRPGLLFVDGHADYWDGETSPTGEAADMELAIIHGHGPSVLASMAPRPLADPARTAILGHRPHELDEDVAAERERVPDEVLQLDTAAIREAGTEMAAALGIERAGEDPWLHIDLDVLDAEAMPAVSYPLAEGLDWDELEALLAPLLARVSAASASPTSTPTWIPTALTRSGSRSCSRRCSDSRHPLTYGPGDLDREGGRECQLRNGRSSPASCSRGCGSGSCAC